MDDKQAVSPIISMVLLIGVVLIVTAAILSWATPILQRSQSEANYNSALGYFNALNSAFEDVVNMGEGASRTVDVSVGAGNIYISETMNETWVVSYGLNSSMRIRFSWLGDSDENFGINSTKSVTVDINVSWYDSNGDYVDCNNTNTDKSLLGGSLEVITVHRNIVTTVNITVTNSSTNEILAELWLFDITPISYELPSSFGTYYIKEFNGGIITQATGQKYVTNAPLFKEGENSILLYMIQTKITDTSLAGSGAGHYSFTLNMKKMNLRNNISMDVYNLTLQIYDKQGDEWSKAWYSYFESNSGFENDGDSLLYSTAKPNNQITLKLMSCNIDVNMNSK